MTTLGKRNSGFRIDGSGMLAGLRGIHQPNGVHQPNGQGVVPGGTEVLGENGMLGLLGVVRGHRGGGDGSATSDH